MVRTGGTQANYTGNALEQYVEHRLATADYQRVQARQFVTATYLEQPVFCRQFHAGTSIYGTNIYADFAVYHPEKWPQCLIIEAKWQQTKGSVDEKYPYLLLNIREQYCYDAILLLDGGGYKAGAEAWIRSQVGTGRLRHVFSMAEFQTWSNQGHI